MRRLRRICAAINFSAESSVVVKSAASLARRFEATIDLVTVVKPAPFYQHIVSARQKAVAGVDSIVEEARRRLAEIAASADVDGLAVEYQVRSGAPFAELIKGAAERDADLLLVGNRQQRSMERLLLGHTVARVLRKAPLPVCVVKWVLPAQPRVVLIATDFSAASQAALAESVALARGWNAHLVLLHILEPLAEPYFWPADPSLAAVYLAEPEDLEPEWQQLIGQLPLTGISWEKLAIKGQAASAIVATAHERSADVIMVGTHGRSGVAHALLGSVAEQVVRQADCAVISVRPDAEPFEVLPAS